MSITKRIKQKQISDDIQTKFHLNLNRNEELRVKRTPTRTNELRQDDSNRKINKYILDRDEFIRATYYEEDEKDKNNYNVYKKRFPDSLIFDTLMHNTIEKVESYYKLCGGLDSSLQ